MQIPALAPRRPGCAGDRPNGRLGARGMNLHEVLNIWRGVLCSVACLERDGERQPSDRRLKPAVQQRLREDG